MRGTILSMSRGSMIWISRVSRRSCKNEVAKRQFGRGIGRETRWFEERWGRVKTAGSCVSYIEVAGTTHVV